MAIARRQALSAFREDPFVLRFRARGYDLSGAVMAFAVRLYPNAEGEALIQLGLTTTRGAAGIRVVATGSEAGVPWTDVEIVGPKDLIAALPFTGEAGADDTFAYDFGLSPSHGSRTR